MAQQWGSSIGKKEPDPLAGLHGKPMVGAESPGTRYVGRVIVELYESSDMSDAHGLAFMVDPAVGLDVDSSDLLKRIAAALSLRAARGLPKPDPDGI